MSPSRFTVTLMFQRPYSLTVRHPKSKVVYEYQISEWTTNTPHLLMEQVLQIRHKDKDSHDVLKVPVRLKRFVELTMDVASASPRRYLFEVMSFFASARHEKERLQHFASAEGRDDLYQYNQKERRTVLEEDNLHKVEPISNQKSFFLLENAPCT